MINYFAIGLTHALLAFAAWRLLLRDDLDADGAERQRGRRKPWLKDAAVDARQDAGAGAPGDDSR